MTVVRPSVMGLGLALLLSAAAPAALAAQETPADTAAVLAEVARRAQAEGRRDFAAQLFRYVLERYPDTPAAQEAARALAALRQWQEAGSGTVALTVWSTTFGAWLGVAVPAAFGADQPEPYGAGLLIGAPLGFFGARTYARGTAVTAGQAELIIFGSQWGTLQGIGWRDVLGIGDDKFVVCNGTCFEYSSTPDEAPFAAAVIGGLAGIGTGVALAGVLNIASGDASLVNHAAWWGSWFGLAGAGLANVRDEDAILAWTLVGGNIGLLASAVGTRAWNSSAGRVRLISAAGLAGLVAGFGMDLLFEIEDNEIVILPLLTSAGGLIAGAALTRDHDRVARAPHRPGPDALLTLGRDAGLGAPLPTPTALRTVDRQGRIQVRPAAQLSILRLRF